MSFDAIAATFFFVLIAVFASIYAYNYFASSAGSSLSDEAASVSANVIENLSASVNGTSQVRVESGRLARLINESKHGDYGAIKDQMGATHDFCVFFEDQNGQIVSIVNSTSGTQTRAMFGSSEVVFTNGTKTTADDLSCASGTRV